MRLYVDNELIEANHIYVRDYCILANHKEIGNYANGLISIPHEIMLKDITGNEIAWLLMVDITEFYKAEPNGIYIMPHHTKEAVKVIQHLIDIDKIWYSGGKLCCSYFAIRLSEDRQ